MRVFDPKTKKEILLPENELHDAVVNGRATFAANDLIPVISPEGEAGTIPAANARDALTRGFKLETSLEKSVREHVEANDNLSGAVKVGLKQFANQALFGVPGIIGDKTKTPLEKLKDDAVKDDHQIANAIGGVTGFGTSLLAGAPLFKGAAAAGSMAERAVASGLEQAGIKRGAKSIASDLAARIAGNAADMGVQSVILSTPQAGAHLITGDPDLAAETLISSGELGLGLGSLGGVLSGGASRIKKAFTKSALTGDALKAANDIPQSTTDKIVSTVTKASPEDMAYAKKNLSRMEATPTLDEGAEKSIPKMFKEDYDKFLDVDLPKMEEKVSKALEKSNVKISTREFVDKIDNIVNQIKSEGAFSEQEQKAIQRMQNYRELLVGPEGEFTGFKDLSGTQVRKYLQKLRKDNSAFRKLNSPTGGDFTLPESVLMDYSESISEMLKDKVGKKYRNLMKDYADKVKLSTRLQKQFGVTNAFQNRIKKPIQDKALGGYSSISFNDKSNNWHQNIVDFSKMVGKDYPTMIQDRLIYAKMFPERALKGDSPTLTSKVADYLGKIDASKPFKSAVDMVTPSAEGLLHSYVTNGGIVNAASKAIAKIERIPEALNNLITKRIPVTLEGSSVSAIQRFLGSKEKKSREDQIQELNEKLGEFTQNPAMAMDHMAQVTSQVPENIGAAVTAKNTEIAHYLNDTIPKPLTPESVFNKTKWKPSASEVSKFERRVQAVADPLSMVNALENGTLSKETVETVKTLYPRLFDIIKQKVIESMQNHKGSVPYSVRVRLSLLLGESFDGSLNPQKITQLQNNFQKPVQASPPSGKLTMPSLQTETERISAR